MKATEAIRAFQKELREFGAAQFGTDNMQTTQACIEAVTSLSDIIRKMEHEGLFSAEWPSEGKPEVQK